MSQAVCEVLSTLDSYPDPLALCVQPAELLCSCSAQADSLSQASAQVWQAVGWHAQKGWTHCSEVSATHHVCKGHAAGAPLAGEAAGAVEGRAKAVLWRRSTSWEVLQKLGTSCAQERDEKGGLNFRLPTQLISRIV